MVQDEECVATRWDAVGQGTTCTEDGSRWRFLVDLCRLLLRWSTDDGAPIARELMQCKILEFSVGSSAKTLMVDCCASSRQCRFLVVNPTPPAGSRAISARNLTLKLQDMCGLRGS